MSRFVRVALFAAALALPGRPSAGLAESFYLSRGRANMEIRSYAPAIEAYRKALAANPRSREASRGVGLALLGNGDTDLAVAELDRHLARFSDDVELAFEQARLLQWSRYAYRARDAVRYLRMGLAVRDDPARRRELARLLGRDRASAGEAVAEYDRLLAASPGDRTLRDERLKLLLWDPSRRDAAVAELRRRRAEDPPSDATTRELARLLAQDRRGAGEAAALYGELLARRLADADLALARARALVRAGKRAEAREAYGRALALRSSTEARLERADLLAAEPAGREEARREYEAVLRAEPGSRRARFGLARLLGARRETSRGAIAEYRAVLAVAPRDPEAHRGLAQAYAWNGDADRALAHGELAQEYGARRPELDGLERSLRRGREPATGAGTRGLAQAGGASGFAGMAAFAAGSAEPTPFTSSSVEAGVARWRDADGAAATGAYAIVRGEWRPEPGTRLRLAGGWDAERLAGEELSGELRAEWGGPGLTLSTALLSAPRRDSFRAFAGERLAGRAVGAASDRVAELRAALAAGDLRGELSARAGAVGGVGFRPVLTAGLAGRLERVLFRPAGWSVSAGGAVELAHHARDLSGGGGDPAAPRLFSPPLFATASPRLALARDDGAGWVRLDAGPAIQLITGARGGLRAGGDVRAALVRRVGTRLRLSAEARAERIAAVYGRLEGAVSAEVLFP